MIDLRVLIDDALPAPWRREHGLALWVTVSPARGGSVRHLLMDVGQHPAALSSNATAAGVDLAQASAVVLSHGHYDHAGGLRALAEARYDGPLFLGPDAERRRFSVQVGGDGAPGRMRKQIGMPEPELLRLFDVRRVGGLCGLDGWLTLFTLPQAAPPNARLLAADGVGADTFSDEVFALVSDGSEEWLLGGCTHHGLPQLLSHVFGQLGRRRIGAFVGGLHLQGRGLAEVESVAQGAAAYGVGRWILLHCTGAEAQAVWRERFDCPKAW